MYIYTYIYIYICCICIYIYIYIERERERYYREREIHIIMCMFLRFLEAGCKVQLHFSILCGNFTIRFQVLDSAPGFQAPGVSSLEAWVGNSTFQCDGACRDKCLGLGAGAQGFSPSLIFVARYDFGTLAYLKGRWVRCQSKETHN